MTGPQDTSSWASDEPRLRGGVDRLLELTFGPRQSHTDCGQRRARAPLKLSSQSGGDDAGTAGSAEGQITQVWRCDRIPHWGRRTQLSPMPSPNDRGGFPELASG